MNGTIVFYDATNPFWRREVRFLKRLDRRCCLHFANIAARGFEPRIFDKTQMELSAEIHALLPDGTWIRGADVLRHVYASVGFRPLVLLTELPLIRQVSNLTFRMLARRAGCAPERSTSVPVSSQSQ